MNLTLSVSRRWGIAIGISILLGVPVVALSSPGDLPQEQVKLVAAAAERAFNQGILLSKQGTLPALRQALTQFEAALNLYRQAGEKLGQASSLLAIGKIYSDLGEKQKALEYYNQSLPLSRETRDRSLQARILSSIGTVYSDLGEKQKALEYYNQSLPLSRETRDRSSVALTLHNMGNAYSVLGDKQKALEHYNQSLSLSQEIRDRQQESHSLLSIGMIYAERGEKQKALDYYSQSLSISQETGDRRWQAVILIGMGNVYSGMGEQQKALQYYSQSLPLSRETGDRTSEALALVCSGRVYSELGEKQTALEYYSQSFNLFQAMGDREQQARILNFMGLVYSDLGEKQKALEYYSQSLPISEAVGDRSGQAVILISIGRVYSELGDQQKALEYYSQSLALFQAIGDRSSQATTLTSIGIVYSNLRQTEKALEYFNQSLSLKRAVRDRSGEAVILTSIGNVYAELEDKQKALEYFNQSLPLRRVVGDRAGEALTLTSIGNVYAKLGDKQKALEYFNQSLPLTQATGDRSAEALTLYSIATVKRDSGNLNEALTNIEASIKIIENLRSKITSPELRISYFATVQSYYEFYIDLLMQLHKKAPNSGYDGKALEASERSRARSLLELLQEANTNIREGVSPELLQQEHRLQQQLNAIEKQRIEVVSGPNSNPSQVGEVDKQRLALLQQYQLLQSKIRTASPRYAALTQPQPLTLPEIQNKILDDNTILLQYSLGEDRSYLWVVTSKGLASYELPKRAKIETAARNFRNSITNSNYRNITQKIAEESQYLSQLILQPVSAKLEKKRLLIVPDGALHYIPFSALPVLAKSKENSNIPLIVDHEIIYLPSASTLAILRQNYGDRKPPNKLLAILADPVFSREDERVKGKIPQEIAQNLESNNLNLNRSLRSSALAWPLNRLPFTRQEAQSIMALVPSASNLEKLDFAATRTTVTDSSLADYQIIHFATHGIANSQNPELSGIVMSMVDENGNLLNGFLRLTDIFNLKLAANLVVLSACQTGMGQNIRGEGIVGLTRGFMYAGTQRVLVSLWGVDDEGTSMLMQRFYQKMLQEKLTPATALRAAQVEMLQQNKWSSPYYWAAFTLQGEWR